LKAHVQSLTILGTSVKKNVVVLGLSEEDCVDVGFVVEGVGEDDDRVAGFDEITLAEEGESRADIGFGITFFEGHLDGLNAAGEGEDTTDVQVRGESEDGRELGALVG
jgi:hypothetical protein